MALADPKKAKVIHVLRDGTVLDSLEGHIPKFEPEDEYRLGRILAAIARKRAAKRNA